MAYQIDFTESTWAGRKFRKWMLRLCLLAVLAGTAWGVYDVYTTYNEPTLNMRLAEYEAVARPVEEMNAEWDAAAKEYDALVRRLDVGDEEKTPPELVSGPFLLNTRNRTLEKNGQRLKLTQIEYLLMKLFMENPGNAMSRDDILVAVWGNEFAGELKTLDVSISQPFGATATSGATEPKLTQPGGCGRPLNDFIHRK